MKTDQTNASAGEAGAAGNTWVSKNSEVDQEIDREAWEFLNELQESKKSNLMIVGWRPD